MDQVPVESMSHATSFRLSTVGGCLWHLGNGMASDRLDRRSVLTNRKRKASPCPDGARRKRTIAEQMNLIHEYVVRPPTDLATGKHT
jgi:hypothetical protein